MPRINVTVREPVMARIKEEKEIDQRTAIADMATTLIEEALELRSKKAGRK